MTGQQLQFIKIWLSAIPWIYCNIARIKRLGKLLRINYRDTKKRGGNKMKSTILAALLLFTGCNIPQADSSCYCRSFEDGSSSCHCYKKDKESILDEERRDGNLVFDNGEMTLINEGERVYIWEDEK